MFTDNNHIGLIDQSSKRSECSKLGHVNKIS